MQGVAHQAGGRVATLAIAATHTPGAEDIEQRRDQPPRARSAIIGSTRCCSGRCSRVGLAAGGSADQFLSAAPRSIEAALDLGTYDPRCTQHRFGCRRARRRGRCRSESHAMRRVAVTAYLASGLFPAPRGDRAGGARPLSTAGLLGQSALGGLVPILTARPDEAEL